MRISPVIQQGNQVDVAAPLLQVHAVVITQVLNVYGSPVIQQGGQIDSAAPPPTSACCGHHTGVRCVQQPSDIAGTKFHPAPLLLLQRHMHVVVSISASHVCISQVLQQGGQVDATASILQPHMQTIMVRGI